MNKHGLQRAITTFCLALLWMGASPKNASCQVISVQDNGLSGNSSGARRAEGAMGHGALSLVPDGFSKLRITPGDLLQVTVQDDADYDGNFRVDQHGSIVLPNVGAIDLDGKSIEEARSAIAKRLLEEEILREPQVNLTVLEYVSPQVTVAGEVASPGRYPLLAPMKLTDVLALAGGVTATAGREIEISPGDHTPVHVPLLGPHHSKRITEEVLVHPGDTVNVGRAGIVYVLGAVTRPGGYVMTDGGSITVVQAVSMANGTTLSASLGKIYLLRRNSSGTDVQIELPFKRMQRGQSGDLQLQPSDILYVPNSKIKSTLVNSQGILAAATSASIFAATAY